MNPYEAPKEPVGRKDADGPLYTRRQLLRFSIGILGLTAAVGIEPLFANAVSYLMALLAVAAVVLWLMARVAEP